MSLSQTLSPKFIFWGILSYVTAYTGLDRHMSILLSLAEICKQQSIHPSAPTPKRIENDDKSVSLSKCHKKRFFQEKSLTVQYQKLHTIHLAFWSILSQRKGYPKRLFKGLRHILTSY